MRTLFGRLSRSPFDAPRTSGTESDAADPVHPAAPDAGATALAGASVAGPPDARSNALRARRNFFGRTLPSDASQGETPPISDEEEQEQASSLGGAPGAGCADRAATSEQSDAGFGHSRTTVGSPVERYVPKAGYRTGVQARAEFKRVFVNFAGPDPAENEARFYRIAREINDIKLAHPGLGWLQEIPAQDLVAVRGYTMGAATHWMNIPLRNLSLAAVRGEVNSRRSVEAVRELEKFDPYIRAVCSGLNALPAHTGMVYRGIQVEPDMLLKLYVPGQERAENFFVSTAGTIGKAWGGNVRFCIQSRYGKAISLISCKPKENEVLFVPGTRFFVRGITPDPARNGDRYDRAYQVDLEEVARN